MKIIDKIWFTNLGGTIGIITEKDEVSSEVKSYIGIGEGVNEDFDALNILDWGSPLPTKILETLNLTNRKRVSSSAKKVKIMDAKILELQLENSDLLRQIKDLGGGDE